MNPQPRLINSDLYLWKWALIVASATSPAIPLSIVPTRWIQPVDAGLRLSPIPAGGTVKIEGHLRGLIVQDMKRDYSKSICVIEMVRLVATLPDIGREPASTSVEKQITVRYPLHMELLECPSWLSPTSTSRISWKVSHHLEVIGNGRSRI